MKSLLILVLGVFVLTVTSVQSKEVCDTAKSCEELKAKVDAQMTKLLNEVTPALTEILKTGVNQDEASEVCKEKGMRLPTARELARVAQSHMALGLSEKEKDGYYSITASDGEGHTDQFYFKDDGYTRTINDLGAFWIWSSSLHSEDPNYAYFLNGEFGQLDFSNRFSEDNKKESVVRCVRLGLVAAPSVHSKEVCDTIEDCQNLRAKASAKIGKLLDDVPPSLTKILKSGVNQYEAENVCSELGMRLPTVRELARYAKRHKAKGISEIQKEGFIQIKGSEINGYPDYFWYSHVGYPDREDEIGGNWIWSSSIHPWDPKNAFGLNTGDGSIDYSERDFVDETGVVRCVPAY